MVLGQISQINKYDIALTLPNNLTGYVPLTSISDIVTSNATALAAGEGPSDESDAEEMEDIDLKALFSVGQYLRAYVTSTSDATSSGGKGKKRVELSINPRQANIGLEKSNLVVHSMVQAAVQSVEDHGLVMSLGLEDTSIRGFMSSKELGYDKDLTGVKQGSVYLCIVVGLSSNGKIVKLSADHQKAGNIKKAIFLTDAPTIDTFLPGTAVELLVTEVSSSGVAGKVMGLLDVTADIIHSGAAASGKPLEKKYPVSSKVKGRVICTFPTATERKLGISFLEHITSLSPLVCQGKQDKTIPTEVIPISTIIEEVRVAKVEPGMGLFVDIGIKGVRGFVHISRIADTKIETLSDSSGKYKTGSVHQGRVTGYNSMDGLFLVSLEQKTINLPFLRLEDIRVGVIVKGTIQKLIINGTGVSGIIIQIIEGITGLVPEMHLADIHLQHPERKFKEGMSVTARVLSINLEKRQTRLTLKKALVNSDAMIWDSYEKLDAGMQAPGTIINILPSGAVVQFYGSIRGFLPISEMSESFIQDPKQHFRIGQVVNVHISSVDPAERRMIVSCRDPSVFGETQRNSLKELMPGTITSGAVSEKNNDEIIIDLSSSGLKAGLPIEHLAEGSQQKCLSIAKKIRVGQTLQDLVVLKINESKRLIRLTNKASLVKASIAGTLLKSFEDVVVGASVVGFVKNITPSGVYVQFAGELTGLLLKYQISDDAVQLPDFGLRRDQSISAKVLSIDHNQQRFLLTQKAAPIREANNALNKPSFLAPDRALSNSVDGVTTSIDDFKLGFLTKARIVSIKETQLNVQLADNVQGRIDVSEVFDSWEDIKDRKHPLKAFSVKQVLSVRMLGIHDSRNHRFLPITHSDKAPVFELSAKPSNQTEAELDILTLDKVKVGSAWLVFVNNVAEDCLWVNLSPNVRGRIRAMDVSEDVSLLTDLATNFPIGSALRARVSNVDVSNNRLDLSARSGTSSSALTLDDLSKGMVVPGRVTKVTERSIMVQLGDRLSAPVNLIDMSDDYSSANPAVYQKNQIIRVCILDLDVHNKRIVLSTRPSKVLSSSLPVKDPEISSTSHLRVNDIVRGFIKNVADNGVFVSLASNITAFVRISDLSDSFVKDWKAPLQIDQLAKGKITAVDPVLNHIQMSLKESVMDKDYKAPLTYEDVRIGQIVTGKVRKVEDFGVFIVIDNSVNVSGLCHRSEMAEHRVSDVKKIYKEGDMVRAKVLKLDLEKRRISFGLKASYFDDVEHDGRETDEDDREDDLDDMEGVRLPEDTNESEEDDDELDSEDLANVQDIESDENNSTNENTETKLWDPQTSASTRLAVQGLSTGGFDWSGGMMDQDCTDEVSDTEEDLARPKKSKRRKAEIKVDRTGDLDADGPQSIADFERLLLGQPNNSYLWLSYMAFQLQLSEIGKAREVAERAIRIINNSGSGESEALNVWVAFLNLENTYGSDESVDTVFKRACEHNDAEEIHGRLTSIYIQSRKNEVYIRSYPFSYY